MLSEFWRQMRAEFTDLMYTDEELRFRREQYELALKERELSVEERIHKKINDYDGEHKPNTVYLGSRIIFQLRMNILSRQSGSSIDDIADINVKTIYGLRVIEVHSRPELINIAYIKDAQYD